MNRSQPTAPALEAAPAPETAPRPTSVDCPTAGPACPVCGGSLMDVKQKMVCRRCHTVVETCCEGGRG